jgi:Uma2 family endonuclease
MVATKLMTASELEALGSDSKLELVEGEPITMSPTGVLHMVVVSRLTRLLTHHSFHAPGFVVWGHEGGFLLSSDPDTVLAPDIAILFDEQVGSIQLDSNSFCPVAPTIAIEVKSPGDREADIARKLAAYLAAGVREVWWIRPIERQITLHRPDRAPEYVAADQIFAGSDVLSGFSFDLTALFDPNPSAV